jgi:hypothetical protein
MIKLLWISLLTVISSLPLSSASKNSYKQWFPQWEPQFSQILKDNCSVQYEAYLTNNPYLDNETTTYSVDYLKDMVDNCILGLVTESLQVNMQSAQVLLGLTPSILSLVGPGTAEISLLSLRRPIFAMLLALGSPSVNPVRALMYHDPFQELQRRRGQIQLGLQHCSTWQRVFVAVLEYVLVFAAVANVTELGYRLGHRTIVAWAANFSYFHLVWSLAVVIIHILGCLTIRLRAKAKSGQGDNEVRPSLRERAQRRLSDEFWPCALHDLTDLEWRPESIWFLIMAWCSSTGTILHMVFGTLVFSGTLFISVQDSLTVVFRYFISALVCRIILMYELAGMRQAFTVTEILARQDDIIPSYENRKN